VNDDLAGGFSGGNPEEIAQVYPNPSIAPIVDIVERHVIAFTSVVKNQYGDHVKGLELVSTANSLKLKNGAWGHVQGTFNAIIRGVDPRKAKTEINQDLGPIAVSCTYDYSI
jgi:hypothetical protein